MLSPYTAEVDPTRLRGTGSGLAAGSSKVGGILGPPILPGLATVSAGFGLLAPILAVPLIGSAAMLAINGVETLDRPLEDVVAESTAGAIRAGVVGPPPARGLPDGGSLPSAD